ncbi:alpha-protein kinase 3-like [Corythoichthys intestinalis]|uniref:alpha-protein kinase 3-like n=1 Tax=Corythoichthys intestinalis TaxID=161448 RepID=UPI0025A6492A|nr:alpha-protein kinase 3-like [Corythoichthys intestinalis]
MGSRRTRSHSANGRSGHGNGISGNSRPGGCSYISNVRPENRSTLCSMIAQLTQETQPAFMTTLKSKAVSESSNVKFFCVVTGYPIPQLTWYKDDKQLDRLCGLPKYEIFRNGQNHSLHIYNCTVEDAAIYQASASNSKGIVSCSGVLEVGGMNEFKIHQRYFAKLKQRTEGRSGKENQKPLRSISPERTQRKRRSTVEVFSSVPSSKEDEVPKEFIQSVGEDSKVRVEEPIEEPMEETLAPLAKSETDNEIGIAKTAFVKKKIKIFPRGERTPEETKESENVKKIGPFGKLLRKKSSEALRSPESAKKNKESDQKCDEKVLEKNPVIPSRLISTPEHQQDSEPVIQHLTDPRPVDRILQKKSALPEQPSDQLPQKETKARQRNSSMQSEVTHAPTWMSGNDAPVSPEPPPDRRLAATNTQQQWKTASKGAASKEDVKPHFGSPIVTVPQHKKLQSKGSSEGHAIPQRSKVFSSVDKKSQACLDMKSVGGLIAQGNKKLDGKEVKKQLVANEKIDKLVTAVTVAPKIQKPEQSRDEVAQVTSNNVVSSKDKQVKDEAAGQHSQKTLIPNEQQSREFQETPKPVARVVSVAEMMRAQISTLDSNDFPADLLDNPATAHKPQNLLNDKGQCTPQGKKASDNIPRNSVNRSSPNENRVQQSHPGNNKIFQKDPSTYPSSFIDSLRDTASVPHVNASNNLDTDPVNPKNKATQGRKSEPEIIPENTVAQTSPEANILDKINIRKNRTCEEYSILSPSSVVEPLKIECNRDVVDIPIAGPVNNPSVAVNPKEEETRTSKSLSDCLPKNPVDQTSPMERLAKKSNLGKSSTFQKDPSLYPSTDPVSIVDYKQDFADIPHVGSSKTYLSVAVNPKEDETQTSKSVSDCLPKNLVAQMSPFEHLAKKSNLGKSHTFHKDPIPSPSSAPGSKVEYNQDFVAKPPAGSSKTYLSSARNPKEEETQRTASKTKSDQIGVLGYMEKFIPNIKVHTETQQESTGNTNKTLIIEHNPKGCSLVMPSPQFIDTDTQENSLNIQGRTMIECNPDNNILPNSNPKVNLLLQKKDGDFSHSFATPQELASGARRKIPSSMDKSGEAKLPPDTQPEKQEVSQPDSMLSTSTVTIMPSPDCTRQSPLLPHPNDEISSPVEKRSPTLGRKKTSAVTLSQPLNKDIKSETSEDRLDPCKAPQVIRKIRSERFADTSGHLKLWCQFFNILTDSTIAWYRNDVEIARITRSATDESQVNLAVIQASSKDSGVYKCAITNDYGSDSTEFLLGSDILGRISQREDHGVGEEIEMAPLVFNKGVADSGVWGNKLFGRVMVDKSCIDEGSTHKVWRAKVIYGLEPVFESGHTCIIKVNREIAYGGKEEHGLTERNLDLVKQHCKIQNLAREYCKIFSAEARVIENFGPPLEVIPVHLMYRPANTIPYATVEADLAGVYQKYVAMDHMGKIETKATSDIGLKCCALQHWIFQWTSGNLLITRLEGVDTKVTNIGITVRSTGHQGFQIEGRPEVFEGFVSQHHCNYFCGLLGLRSLKILDSLTTPAKSKGSRSPLLQRKNQASGSCSPQTGRRAAGSPRTPRKSQQDVTNTLKVAVEVSP